MYLNTPGVEWIHTTEAAVVASIFASISIIISLVHIMQHLSHYTMPGIQLYVIRILIICPVYAISSALAVGLGKNGQYAEVARDVYEAFVIYSFLNLIMEYCGGETDCVYQIENEPLLRFPCPLCFMKPRQRDARLIRTLKRGVLQFVIIKPIFAVIDIIMIATGEYYLLPYQFFEMFVYNISYTWALYCMYLFYLATNKIIKKFRPVLKFASVKLIVFATYYQSLFVKASSMSPENSIMWNDLLLCIEMVIFASILMCAFPTSEFEGGVPESRLMNNVKDVLKIKDVVQDVYHNFMPVYQEYTLQRSDREAPETVRVKTYLAGNLDSVAIEMSHRYRGRNKRFAFNSLLRGDTPIRAQLRSNSNHLDSETQSKIATEIGRKKSVLESDTESRDDLGSDELSDVCSADQLSEESLYEKFIMAQKNEEKAISNLNFHNVNKYRSYSSDDELSSSSDCLTANVRHHHFSLDENQNLDVETGMMNSHNNEPNIVIHQLNPIEMDIYQRRVNFMRTHGIGMIVTDHGVEVRPSSYCPTEEECVVNVDFMNKDLSSLEHFQATSSHLYSFPAQNVAAAILPRITSSKEKGKKAKEHQKRVDTAVRNEEMFLQFPVGDRATKSSSADLPSPYYSPSTSSENLSSLTKKSATLTSSDDKDSLYESRKLLKEKNELRKQQQQQQRLEKMKLLPPITAISAPRITSLANSSHNKKLSTSIANSNSKDIVTVDEKLANKERRGISEGSDDWGDFQSNHKLEVSPEKSLINNTEVEVSTAHVGTSTAVIEKFSAPVEEKHYDDSPGAEHVNNDEDSCTATKNPMLAGLNESCNN